MSVLNIVNNLVSGGIKNKSVDVGYRKLVDYRINVGSIKNISESTKDVPEFNFDDWKRQKSNS